MTADDSDHGGSHGSPLDGGSHGSPLDGGTAIVPPIDCTQKEPLPAGWFAALTRARTSRAGGAAISVWFLGGWFGIAMLVWLVVSRWANISVPVRFTLVLQSLTPWVFLPMYILLFTALLARRWIQSGTAFALVVAHIFAIAPALTSTDSPVWAASAPTIRIVSSNVYDANSTPAAAAATLLDQNADVLMIVEMTPTMLRELVSAGIDERYPYQLIGRFSKNSSAVESVFSRVPFITSKTEPVGQQHFPIVTLDVGGQTIELVAVHIDDPVRNVDEWKRELASLRALRAAADVPIVIAGDFNSTRWSPEFGMLLENGLVDASESAGNGLSFSWPIGRFPPFPVMRLDHALGTSGLAPTLVRDLTVPGSDHRALDVTWAVQQPKSP